MPLFYINLFVYISAVRQNKKIHKQHDDTFIISSLIEMKASVCAYIWRFS